MVECNLAKVDVAGSNPVSRSIFVFDGMGVTAHGCGSGPLAQLVEQVTLNHKVVGSIPSRPTSSCIHFRFVPEWPVPVISRDANPCQLTLWASGGIGRRAGLRIQYRKMCGFNSRLAHQL